MWKLSCIVLSLMTIGNSSTHDRAGTTEISRNFRNYENQRYFDAKRSSTGHTDEIVKRDRRDAVDYSSIDTDEFEADEPMGKWRNSGSALEPKWRDGDSVPLVPFVNSSRLKKFSRRDESSKLHDSDEKLSRLRMEETIEKIPISLDHRSSVANPSINDRYSLDKNLKRSHDDSHDRRNNAFSQREKMTSMKNFIIQASTEGTRGNIDHTRWRNEEFSYESQPDATSGSRKRYGIVFQANPNEYELNDDEYEKPRPRKRRPPQNYEFIETRSPTYSITWSTERYTENTENFDEFSTTRKTTRKPEVTTWWEKKKFSNRQRDRDSTSFDARRRMENAELKSLLKMQQIEGLSLSEILQRRNFTLNDLLRGRAEVLDVLKSSDSDGTEIIGVKSKIFESVESKVNEKIATLNDEIFTTEQSNDNNVKTVKMTSERETNDSMEKIDSTKTWISDDKTSRVNEKLSTIGMINKNLKIFARNASHVSANRTDLEAARRNDENSSPNDESTFKLRDDDEIMEFSDFNTKRLESTTTTMLLHHHRTRNNGYEINDETGSTLSIENILSTTQRSAENRRINDETRRTAVKNNTNSDIVRIIDEDYASEEPTEIIKSENANRGASDDESTMSDEPREKEEEEEEEKMKIHDIFDDGENNFAKNHLILSERRPYELVVSEIEPEARAEIFELFSTGSSAKRLERLLESRNMSIDELIELRRRGSSKLHLAEILSSRDEAASRNYDSVAIESSRDVKTRKINESGIIDLSDIETEPKTTEMREFVKNYEQTNVSLVDDDDGEDNDGGKFDSTKANNVDKNEELLELLRSFDSLPFSIRPERARGSIANDENVASLENSKLPTNNAEIGLVEEIRENENFGISENRTETDILKNCSTKEATRRNEKKINSPRIRPSIIASGAILGVTIVVFLAIFIVMRIRNKQKYTYRNTFARGVFQGTTMTARKLSNSSSLNTIMVNVVAGSNPRPDKREMDENFESKSDIENDSLDANDSWETIPNFMK